MLSMKERLELDINDPLVIEERDEQEVCFISLPIPKIKPHVSEVLIQTPADGFFYVLLNGMYTDAPSSAWMYIANDGGGPRQFSSRSEVIEYLSDLKYKGYNLDYVRVIQEFDFDRGGEFDDEKTHSKMVPKKRARGNGSNWPK